MNADTEPQIIDNSEEHRYEVSIGDARAGVIEYDTEPGAVVLIHTEVAPAFEGRGLATKLIAGAIDDIRARGLKVVPLCPFVVAYLQRHPQDRDLVAPPPAAQ
jgi:predicted GNAT family acetyltransferase